jgi:hypothetical protein
MSSHRSGRRSVAGWVLCLLIWAPAAHAGLFGKPVNEATPPDATVRIAFPYRPALGFDPKSLNIEATYHASKPDEKGVRTVTRKSRSCPVEIPVPFGCTTHKYTETVDVPLTIKKEWLTPAGPNAFVIHLPERLRGPGDYQLTELQFACPDALCHGREPIKEWKMAFSSGARIDKVPAFMRLGVDEASTFTAAFEGKTLQIETTAGSHSAKAFKTYVDERELVRAVQDESGQWHISGSAYTAYYEGSCAEPFMSSTTDHVKAKDYAGMAWAVPFKELAYGSVYDTIVYGPNTARRDVKPSEWTGCIAFKAEGLAGHNDDYEVRYYAFENGRLRSRRISRYALRMSLENYVELDAGQRLLFYRQHTYVDKTKGETDQSWSRLQYEAYPKESPPLPQIDVKALLSEAEDVRAIIAPHFNQR